MEERFYDEYARIQDRHWWFIGRRRIVQTVLEQTLPDQGNEIRRILDVGCGTGTNLGVLQRFGAVEGVDAERAAVEFCHRRGQRSVRLAPASSLPYPDRSFDLVTLLDVIEHVEDDQVVLDEAWRVLVPGGRLLVTVPAYMWMWGPHDLIAHHYRRYTGGRLLESLVRADFVPTRSTYFNTLLFPPIAAIRLGRRVIPGPDHEASDFELNQPGLLNSLLARVFSAEAPLLRHVSFPFGVSVAGLARRRER